MRITNKIIQNNSLYNINNNKVLQDKLNTQMATQKKITRPSDDPIIAIRALRLRSNVAQISQFNDKNAPDADSWLTVTGDALETVSDVLTDMIARATKAANKDLTIEDMQIVLQEMDSLAQEFYATGNVDFAGRYIFTGYRTNTAMTFSKEDAKQNINYTITEQLSTASLDTINYTNTAGLEGLTKENYNNYASVVEQNITNSDIIRMRLSYDNMDDAIPEITKKDGTPFFSITTPSPETLAIEKQSLASNPHPYAVMAQADKDGQDKVIFIPETGELLISKTAHEKYITGANISDDEEIRVTYTKSTWDEGDLRPEHYFACWKDKGVTGDEIVYNDSFLTDDPELQHIEYDVGYNQKIRVNTTASEVFTPSVKRMIDDLKYAIEDLAAMDSTVSILKKELEGASDDQLKEQIQQQLDAANKAYDYVRQNVHELFEKTITDSQKALDDTSVAITDNGTRSQRLDLISNRLLSQKTTYKDLQSTNEDADIAEVAIQLTSMELSYNSALMATGKILQTSLMNFI